MTLKKKIKELVKASQEKAKEEKKEIQEVKINEINLRFKFTKNEIKQINKACNEIKVVKKQRERSKDPKIKNKTIVISLSDP